MTDIPDYILPASSTTQAVHTEPPKNYQWQSLSQDQLNQIRSNLITSILQVVIQAITGIFIPGGGLGGATGQLTNWASGIPILGDIVQALTGTFGGLDILGPLTGLFAPFINLFDGTGSPTGAGNFTDNGDGTGIFDLGALGDLIDSGDGTGMSIVGLLENLIGQLGTFQSTQNQQQSIIDMIFGAIRGGGITGNQPSSIFDALRNIPFLNVLGIGGPGNIGESVGETWNQLIGGFVGAIGSGAGLADLFDISQNVSSRATLGQFSWDILGIRNNRSLNSGFLPTSISNINMDKVALASVAPTVPVTRTTALTSYHRIEQSMNLGAVSWQGYGVTNVTNAYVNIFQMNTSTGVNTLLHTSSDIVGSLTGGSAPVPVVYSLPTAITGLQPGDVVGVEINVRGTGTHNVAGATTWLSDQTVFPRRFSSVRDSSTTLSPATVNPTYSSNVPFVEIAVSAGDVALPHTPTITMFNTVGTTTMPIPTWVNFIDVAAVGSGGGGHQGGSIGIGGEGGAAGDWATTTWERGTHFTGGSITITIGAGGSAGVGGNGGNGGDVTASVPGFTVTGTGGVGANSFDLIGSQHTGESPGNITYNSQTYVGGGQQNNYGATGAAPGGGGAGGNWISFQPGGAGAVGRVWIRVYQ